MGMWNELVGQRGYLAGVAGTATVPRGARVLQIVAHGVGTVAIFGGTAIPTPVVPLTLAFRHTLWQARDNAVAAGSQDIVFAGTTGFFVEFVTPGSG